MKRSGARWIVALALAGAVAAGAGVAASAWPSSGSPDGWPGWEAAAPGAGTGAPWAGAPAARIPMDTRVDDEDRAQDEGWLGDAGWASDEGWGMGDEGDAWSDDQHAWGGALRDRGYDGDGEEHGEESGVGFQPEHDD